MFKTNSKKSSSPSSWTWPTTDIHAHLLPGIDDGPKTTKEALSIVKGLVQLGYKRLVATPHVMMDLHPNTTKKIVQTYEEFRRELEKQSIAVELFFAAEYFMDEAFEELMRNDDLLTLFGNHILIEMSTLSVFPKYHEYIFALKTKGYRPILAHPERYTYFHKDIESFERLKNMGCLFQINILSLQGYYGKQVKNCAIRLLERNLVDFLGTDTHHLQHLRKLENIFQQQKLLHFLENQFFHNDGL